MNVTEALRVRTSTRAFLDKPVDIGVVTDILCTAGLAPSGGNLQPWKVWILTGPPLERFRSLIASRLPDQPWGEGTEYDIYPKNLTEPYRTRRFVNGEAMYGSVGIPREDKAGRLRQFARNFEFFGAPVGLFFAIDRQMQIGQWVDLGIYLQSVMLLAAERGLATCPQEAWAVWHKTIGEFVDLPPEMMLFCGMALGYADDSHPINSHRSDRAPISEFVSVIP